MNALDLLKGKHMMVMTDMKVVVELEIEEVVPNTYSRDLEPATAANDWYPASESWTKYKVNFTNGASKEFDSLKEINVH